VDSGHLIEWIPVTRVEVALAEPKTNQIRDPLVGAASVKKLTQASW
jgi:hypothetical protein